MSTEDVGGIAVPLGMDLSGFSAGIRTAKSEIASLGAKPVTVRVKLAPVSAQVNASLGLSRHEADRFRVSLSDHLRSMASQGSAVGVPIKIGRTNWSQLRQEIAAGIGTVSVPIKLVAPSSPVARANLSNVVAATVAESTGADLSRSQMFVKGASLKRGVPLKGAGGYASGGGNYVVGDAGREVFVPRRAMGGTVRNPIEGLRAVARDYSRSVGIASPTEGRYLPLDTGFSQRTAAAYERMPTGANAASRASFEAFRRETMAQYAALRQAGYHFTPSRSDPYEPTASATKMQLARADVFRNKNLNVFAGALGHPLVTAREQFAFRGVHDLFGHLTEGYGIGPRGEFNAAAQHSQMYSPLARQAMLSLTHGQNSFVNFSNQVLPGYGGRSVAQVNNAAPGSIYAQQKASILPADIISEFLGRTRAGGGPVFRRVGADRFSAAITSARGVVKSNGRRVGETVYQYPNDEYSKMSTYLSRDGLTGYAIKPDGDLVSVFNVGARGRGTSAVRSAVQRGATHLDAFDESGRLPDLYSKFGFRETGRDPWNPDYAPEGWRGGTPDVVYMARQRARHRAMGGPVMYGAGGFAGSIAARLVGGEGDFEGNLRAAHDRLRAHHIEGGKAWYDIAGTYGRGWAKKAGVSDETAVGILAALSAGTAWSSNKTKFEKVLTAHMEGKPFPYDMSLDAHRKAYAILNGADPKEAFKTSPKVGQFYPGMMGDLGTLTIDRWALRTATQGKLSQIGKGPVRSAIEAAWRKVAKEYGMEPAVSQAALWLQEKEESLQAPGQTGMFAAGGFMQKNGFTVPVPRVSRAAQRRAARMPRDARGRFMSPYDQHGSMEAYLQTRYPGDLDFHDLALRQEYRGERIPWRLTSDQEAMWPGFEGRARGGYIVGEKGKELYVPDRMREMIPRDVMSALPKREKGGPVEIGVGGPQYWSPPEDGWIIPNHLLGRMRARGGPVSPGQMGMGFGGNMGGPINMVGTPGLAISLGGALAAALRAGAPAVAAAAAAAAAAPPVAAAAAGAAAAAAAGTAGGAAGTGGGITGGTGVGRRARGRRILGSDLSPAEELAERLRGAGEFLPGRTPRGVVASLSSLILGGRGASEQSLAAARRSIRRAGQLETRYSDVRDQTIAARNDYETALRAAPAAAATLRLRDAYRALRTERTALMGQVRSSRQEAAELTEKAIPRPANIVQNIAAIGLATTAYGLLSTGIETTLSQVTKAGGRAIDQLNGFQSTSNRVTSALGDQTTALHGNAEAAVASAAEYAGLSRDALKFLDSSLRVSASVKSGAAAAGQASELFRATIGNQTSAPRGLFGGYGGINGGPFLAELLGGGKGYTETLAGDLSSFQQRASGVPSVVAQLNSTDPFSAAIGQISRLFSDPVGTLTNPLGDTPSAEQQGQAASTIAAYVKNINDQAGRGAQYMAQTTGNLELISGATKEQADAFRAMGAAAGDGANAAKLASNGFVVIDRTTKQVVSSAQAYTKFFTQAATGASVPDIATVIAQQQRALTAGFQATSARVAFQRNVQNPAAVGFSLLANPLINPAAGVLPSGGIGQAGLSGGAASQTSSYLQRATEYQDKLNAEAQRGLEIARKTVVENGGNVAVYDSAMKAAKAYSGVIASLQTTISFAQSTLEAKEFNTQMYYLKRNLSDARGLAGQGGGPGNLGALQRKSFMIGREQTALGLGLQQRQITTQLALAQFQAPGESPEERYARQQEAIIQARIAQKQLNLSKQQFGVQGQIFNVESSRGVGDAQRAVELAQAAHDTAVQINAASKELAAAQALQSVAIQKAQAEFGGATERFDQKLSVAAGVAAQFGVSVTDVIKMLNGAVGALADPKTGLPSIVGSLWTGISTALSGLFASIPGLGASQSGVGGGYSTGISGTGTPHAMGTVGLTMGTQSMMIGEAGSEAYAILRNPRMAQLQGGSAGGSSSGGSVTVNFNGPISVGKDGDMTALKRAVTDAVLEGISRKARLTNLRPVAY